jgi:hypothetical protein
MIGVIIALVVSVAACFIAGVVVVASGIARDGHKRADGDLHSRSRALRMGASS